jgi:hypothetical protein
MFHVPERDRVVDHPLLGSTAADGNNGAFDLASPAPGWRLAIVCSDGTEPRVPEGLEWEHVSVHAYRETEKARQMRCPSWAEMCFVKGLYWDDEDVVVQYHPKRSEYVNNHPAVLHLWRHRTIAYPQPPSSLVGIR